jgi:hypothetical protein
MDKKKKLYLSKESVISGIIIPVVSFGFGTLFCNLIDTSLAETIIISLLFTLTASSIEHSIRNQVASDKLCESDGKLEIKLDELKILSEIQEGIQRNDHPYFRRWAFRRLDQFIEQNTEFFEGTNRTNPHAEDTFGIDGIKETLKFGSIKAVSVVEDYWEDAFTKEYLRVQEELIRTKKVRIQRIFVTSSDKLDKIIPAMEAQYKLGIEVFYIYYDNQFVNREWLKEDYLIQDDRLLVQIYCESHKYNDMEKETELITVVPAVVNRKIDRFLRILERAEKFDPGTLPMKAADQQEKETPQCV